MKRKYFFVIILILIITGCTNEYNLTFSNDKIKEKIVSTIPDSSIPTLSEAEEQAGISLDDPITPYIENDQYPFANNDKIKYDKSVERVGNTTTVTLEHTYTHEEFQKSRVLTQCFEETLFEETRNGYNIDLSGSFYCYYGYEMTINIKTNNEVLSNNADRVAGNTYTWYIRDKNNIPEIHMQISKKSAFVTPILMIILIIIGLILLIFGFITYQRIKNRESVNDI